MASPCPCHRPRSCRRSIAARPGAAFTFLLRAHLSAELSAAPVIGPRRSLVLGVNTAEPEKTRAKPSPGASSKAAKYQHARGRGGMPGREPQKAPGKDALRWRQPSALWGMQVASPRMKHWGCGIKKKKIGCLVALELEHGIDGNGPGLEVMGESRWWSCRLVIFRRNPLPALAGGKVLFTFFSFFTKKKKKKGIFTCQSCSEPGEPVWRECPASLPPSNQHLPWVPSTPRHRLPCHQSWRRHLGWMGQNQALDPSAQGGTGGVCVGAEGLIEAAARRRRSSPVNN